MTPRIFSIARVRRLDRDDTRQVDLPEICTTIRKSSTARANALPIGGAWSGHGEDHHHSISAVATATAVGGDIGPGSTAMARRADLGLHRRWRRTVSAGPCALARRLSADNGGRAVARPHLLGLGHAGLWRRDRIGRAARWSRPVDVLRPATPTCWRALKPNRTSAAAPRAVPESEDRPPWSRNRR